MGVFISVAVFLLCLAGIIIMQKKKVSFNILVLVGLVGGIAFGLVLQLLFAGSESLPQVLRWISLPGTAYVRLLKMMVIPLIFVSITCAIINQKANKNLGKTTAVILAVLLGTVLIAASVGGLTARAFHLTSEGLQIGEAESSTTAKIEERSEAMAPIEQTIVNIIPTNPINALAGNGDNPTLSVVFFAVALGIAVRGVRTYAAPHAEFFEKFMDSLNTIIVELVMMILMLTPYGIFSLMANTMAGSDFASILRLVSFVLASYIAIFVMFVIHGLILGVMGFSPRLFFKKSLTALSFAFTSRTSAGTLPLTTRTLTEKMGVSEGVASLAASLGTSIGQNGCAGVYPAMLVMMVAPAMGKEITVGYFLLVVVVVMFSSIGIAGVGGGATFAGITVLSVLGLPVGIAGLLVAVEPLIDMARTALNVSDSMVAALVTAKATGNLDKAIYDDASAEFSTDVANGH